MIQARDLNPHYYFKKNNNKNIIAEPAVQFHIYSSLFFQSLSSLMTFSEKTTGGRLPFVTLKIYLQLTQGGVIAVRHIYALLRNKLHDCFERWWRTVHQNLVKCMYWTVCLRFCSCCSLMVFHETNKARGYFFVCRTVSRSLDALFSHILIFF